MTNNGWMSVLAGGAFFVGGYLGASLLNTIMPPLLTALTTYYSSTELQELSWFIVILFTIILAIIIPLALIYKGVIESVGKALKYLYGKSDEVHLGVKLTKIM